MISKYIHLPTWSLHHYCMGDVYSTKAPNNVRSLIKPWTWSDASIASLPLLSLSPDFISGFRSRCSSPFRKSFTGVTTIWKGYGQFTYIFFSVCTIWTTQSLEYFELLTMKQHKTLDYQLILRAGNTEPAFHTANYSCCPFRQSISSPYCHNPHHSLVSTIHSSLYFGYLPDSSTGGVAHLCVWTLL